MRKCVGADCEYFDSTSYVDAQFGNSIPYCKQKLSNYRPITKRKLYMWMIVNQAYRSSKFVAKDMVLFQERNIKC